MANEGERVDETTSYELQPPGSVPEQSAGERDEQQSRLLGGRYRLLSRLGHGGMGTVWRALDEVVDREVAVKEPRLPESVPDRMRTTVYERMRREARAAARIDHPSVVTMHDVVVERGQPWLVMELVRGESLADVLETGTVDPREAARVGLAVLEALHAAHEVGVLHRDVKPANVLLGAFDRVVLTDFGIARVEGEQGLTETGEFVGSAEFVAPERASGQLPGPESDFFSLGVLLYVAIEGVSPFRRTNAPATLQAVIATDPPPPTRATGELAGLIMGLLAKRPAARPDVSEIRRVLREAANPPRPALPRPKRLTWPKWPRSRRGRWLAVGGGVVAAGLVGVLLVTLLSSDGDGVTWERHEEEALRAEIEVPDVYQHVEDDGGDADSARVTYESPDEIYAVDLRLYTDEPAGVMEMASGTLANYQSDVNYQQVSGEVHQAEFQGQEAARLELLAAPDNWEDFEPPDDEPRVQHYHLFFAPEGQTDEMWRVRVTMPGEEGNAKQYGEQLFEEVLDRLVLHEDGG